MAEYLTGYPPTVAAVTNQLRSLSEVDGLLIGGTFVRAAMYETYEWPDAPALELGYDTDTGLLHLDIDVFMPYGRVDIPTATRTPAYVDTNLNDIIGHPAGNRLSGSVWGHDLSIAVDPAALERREYHLNGAPVMGLRPDTQYFVDCLPPGVESKYIASRGLFAQFMRWLEQAHPDAIQPLVSHEAFHRYRKSIPRWDENIVR